MLKVILLKDDDGEILQATEFEPVDRADLVEQIKEATDTLRKLQVALTNYDKLVAADNGTSTEEQVKLHGVKDDDGNIKFVKKAVEEPPTIPIHPIII